jgi:SRSO17 transposase
MDETWKSDLDRWLAPFLGAFRHKTRARMCPVYVAGLIGVGDRKSVQPMAARDGEVGYDQLHHFIASGVWDAAPLDKALLTEADRMVGGADAWLIVDDTALPKKGEHSVGVAPQYASSLGKTANCQSLVSLTLASREVPVMVGLRLFLPESWTDDPERMARARVPEDRRTALTKPEIAIEEIDRVIASGAARRVRIADGHKHRMLDNRMQCMPGGEVWLVGERRSTGEKKYYVSNLPANTSLKTLAATIKARWVCEQAHQQLKEELGLDHFEGRSWTGLHRHALMTMIAYAFLQSRRLKAAGRKKKNRGTAATTEHARHKASHPQPLRTAATHAVPAL